MKKLCGICQTDGKSKDAVWFCKKCDSWICDDCKESHDNFRDLQNHIIVTKHNMIYSDSTAASDVSDRLRQLSTKPLEEETNSRGGSRGGNETKPQSNSRNPTFHSSTKPSAEETYPRGGSRGGNETKPQSNSRNEKSYSSTQPSDSVDTVSSQTKPTIASRTAQHDNINILGYTTIKMIKETDMKASGDKKDRLITGCCFMSKGELIACDNNNLKIKLLDRSLSLVDSLDLPGKPWDVAALDNSNVIVTMPGKKQLQFIQVLPSLKRVRTIDVGKECRGVAVADDKIFISCYNYTDWVGDIRVYDIEGRVLVKRLGINPDGSSMFRWPQYVAVSWSGDKIFVSDYNTITLSCLTSDGKLVYQYRDMELKGPTGLLVDDNDNVIVCGYYSNTIQVITSTGKKHKTLLSSEDGIKRRPVCVSFRPSDRTLIVGGNNNNLLVYQMT